MLSKLMLTAQQLTLMLKNQCIIDQVSLTIKAGEVIAIIGPNGAGKSTLLKLLSGFVSADSGDCILLGKPLKKWDSSALSKVRTVMRQHATLSFSFRAKDVITMGRAPHGKKYYHQAIQSVIEQTNCHHLCEKDYRFLSGGEQQRIQLARVLAQLWHPEPEPRLLFLDEPTSVLDLYHQQQTLCLLRSLTRKNPFSVCCVLHDLNLAAL